MKSKSITASSLSKIRAIEGDLARKESKQLIEDLPPGHPLLDMAQQEAGRTGDLTSLPETHPLKVALNEARERVLAQQEKEKSSIEAVKVRKAKRIKDQKEYLDRAKVEEEEKEKRIDSFKVINEKIDKTIQCVDTLLTVLVSNSEVFGEDHYNHTKAARLERMIKAVRRGLSDSKLRISRV
jgi:hypothetical protein